jgi:uncharacterized protein YqjF (DUF2071 family)
VRVGEVRQRTVLDDFLSARWGLHLRWWGRTRYLPVAHRPWPMRDAEVLSLDDELVRAAGLGDVARRTPDHVAFSDGVDTEFGLPMDASLRRS